MKTVAWLVGIGSLVASAGYMLVSLNRWEWNRALFFGIVLLIAEVGLATALVLRKLNQLMARGLVDPDVAQTLRDTRPPKPDRFGWLKQSTTGQLNVFITFLVGGGVVLSGLAWLIDRVASVTSTPVREGRLARRLAPISYPDGGPLAEDEALSRLLGY
jgi:hypothetical protein